MSWPRGLSESLQRIEPLVSQSYNEALAARRRLWSARDEIQRLKTLLANAEAALALAERDDADGQKTMRMIWEDWRDQVMAIPVSDGGDSASGRRSGESGRCSSCGESGHYYQTCPKRVEAKA